MITSLAVWLYVWGGILYATQIYDTAPETSEDHALMCVLFWPVVLPVGLALSAFNVWRDEA